MFVHIRNRLFERRSMLYNSCEEPTAYDSRLKKNALDKFQNHKVYSIEYFKVIDEITGKNYVQSVWTQTKDSLLHWIQYISDTLSIINKHTETTAYYQSYMKLLRPYCSLPSYYDEDRRSASSCDSKLQYQTSRALAPRYMQPVRCYECRFEP